MMKMRSIPAALAVLLVTVAAPAAAQADVAPAASLFVEAGPAAAIAPDSPETPRPALFPALCLSCEARWSQAPRAALEAERLPRGMAPLIGGVAGAVAGLAAMRLSCGEPGSCEMGDLVGILGGAVIGFTIGHTIERTLP
jgi:hypothetical protein